MRKFLSLVLLLLYGCVGLEFGENIGYYSMHKVLHNDYGIKVSAIGLHNPFFGIFGVIVPVIPFINFTQSCKEVSNVNIYIYI